MRNNPDLPAQDDPAFDTPAAADYLGLRPNTLEGWRSSGRHDLPFEKLGRRVIYRKSKLDRFRAGRTYTSTGQYPAAAQ